MEEKHICQICGRELPRTQMPLHVIACNKNNQNQKKENPEMPTNKNPEPPAKPTPPVTPVSQKASSTPPVTPVRQKPYQDRKVVLIAAGCAFLVLLIIAAMVFVGYNKLNDAHQEKIAAMEEQAAAEAALAAAEVEKQAAEEAARRVAEAEARARAEPVQPPFTNRKEPPTIVQVDEFIVDTGQGKVLLGLPVIKGHGKQGVYLGSAPPASEVKFAHDSKWARDGNPVDKWTHVQIAAWDPDNRRYIPVPGLPLITRTLPDGNKAYQTHVWALVKAL